MEIGSPTARRGIEETDGLGRPGRRAQAPAGMTTDLDIYRTASVLIREHGEDAALEAAQRADAMLEKGSLVGSCHAPMRADEARRLTMTNSRCQVLSSLR
jgi:hypothetical protein